MALKMLRSLLTVLNPLLLAFGILMASCAPTAVTNTSADYYEDLTQLRPTFEEPAWMSAPEEDNKNTADPDSDERPLEPVALRSRLDITHRLDSLLDSIAVNNQRRRTIQGYTIQVYTGGSQEEANLAKSEVYRLLPQSKPKVTYDLPNYKVKVGKFYYRLEAQQDFAQIKRTFPSAILVPELFPIN